jgi:hypothetical protein
MLRCSRNQAQAHLGRTIVTGQLAVAPPECGARTCSAAGMIGMAEPRMAMAVEMLAGALPRAGQISRVIAVELPGQGITS